MRTSSVPIVLRAKSRMACRARGARFLKVLWRRSSRVERGRWSDEGEEGGEGAARIDSREQRAATTRMEQQQPARRISQQQFQAFQQDDQQMKRRSGGEGEDAADDDEDPVHSQSNPTYTFNPMESHAGGRSQSEAGEGAGAFTHRERTKALSNGNFAATSTSTSSSSLSSSSSPSSPRSSCHLLLTFHGFSCAR